MAQTARSLPPALLLDTFQSALGHRSLTAGFADPEAAIGYAYVTSKMGARVTGDPRDIALREALYGAIARQ